MSLLFLLPLTDWGEYMQYYFYIDGVLMPVSPSKVNMSAKNNNKTYELTNGSEVNIIKPPGFVTVSFELLIPSVKYPFASYSGEFKEADYYLDLFKRLKASAEPFEFLIIRTLTSKTVLKMALRLLPYSSDIAKAVTGDGSKKISTGDARKLYINEADGRQTVISDTTMTVTLEKLEITEDAERTGRDFTVSLELKEYEPAKIKTVVLKKK